MKVLIIEDERGSALELSQLITAVDSRISIVAILESVEESLNWLSANDQPDLIFSDIQLADGLSFEIYKKFHVNCPIIFCSAFDEYLMAAFETNAISYILKPVTREKVKSALDKLQTLRESLQPDDSNPQLQRFIRDLKQPVKTTILVNQREKFIPVAVKDIAYFYMENTVVEVGTINNQQYFLTNSLDEIEHWVEPNQFYRANRQYLINREAIANAERFFSRKLVVKLQVPTADTIVVSKAKASDFLHWLQYL